VNTKPALGHLASNGGPTKTLLPGTTSPAANVIPDPTLPLAGVAVCPATDQRGDTRPGRGETGCTIGAVEVGLTSPTTTLVTLIPATATTGTKVAYQAVVNPQSGTGTPTGTITFTTGTTSLCTAVLSGGVAACGAANASIRPSQATAGCRCPVRVAQAPPRSQISWCSCPGMPAAFWTGFADGVGAGGQGVRESRRSRTDATTGQARQGSRRCGPLLANAGMPGPLVVGSSGEGRVTRPVTAAAAACASAGDSRRGAAPSGTRGYEPSRQ
jgi:hypothetical protein